MSSPVVNQITKSGRARVLIVDDEPAVLLTTEAILEDRFDVTTAQSGEEALAILGGRDFEAVCADYAMGRGMNGIELLRTVAALPSITGRVLVTGQQEFGASASLYYVLLKPYESPRLIEVVERAVSQALARRRIVASASDARRATSPYLRLDGAEAPTRR
jgi:CheY-like chemotaxis protein